MIENKQLEAQVKDLQDELKDKKGRIDELEPKLEKLQLQNEVLEEHVLKGAVAQNNIQLTKEYLKRAITQVGRAEWEAACSDSLAEEHAKRAHALICAALETLDKVQ